MFLSVYNNKKDCMDEGTDNGEATQSKTDNIRGADAHVHGEDILLLVTERREEPGRERRAAGANIGAYTAAAVDNGQGRGGRHTQVCAYV